MIMILVIVISDFLYVTMTPGEIDKVGGFVHNVAFLHPFSSSLSPGVMVTYKKSLITITSIIIIMTRAAIDRSTSHYDNDTCYRY